MTFLCTSTAVWSQVSISYRLVDAAADTILGPFSNQDTIDLAPTSDLNVIADITPTSNVGSVKFFTNGNY
ncbi:MAG: hypothetical protein U5L96_09445 [Owenweeksia sp.]|nr:hypothetical protein [Owenweeksia sp.]